MAENEIDKQNISQRRFSGKTDVNPERMTLVYNNMKFQAPPDFRQLLEEVTKSVLEDQPADVALYLARFFTELNNNNVFQEQRARIKAIAEKAKLQEAEKQAAAKKEKARKAKLAAEMRVKRMTIMKANILAEAERQRQEDELLLQEHSTYLAEEAIKSSIAIRQEQILRNRRSDTLEKLELEKEQVLHTITGEIHTLEHSGERLDEIIERTYNKELSAHLQKLAAHQTKAAEYRAKLADLDAIIAEIQTTVEELNTQRPKMHLEKVAILNKIEALTTDKNNLMRDYNSHIIDLEIEFKNELEQIHKFLT